MPKYLLTAAENKIVRLHRTLKAEFDQGVRLKGHTLRQVIKDSTGYALSTISSVFAHWNKHHDPLFASTFGARGHRLRLNAEYYGPESVISFRTVI
jgi:hypothetical protein